MATFDLNPEFTYTIKQDYSTLSTPFESGHVQLRARWTQPRRHWVLVWNNATPDEAEQLRGWLRDHTGSAGTFDYVPSEKVARPYLAPTLGQTAGGALGQHTCYAEFTWSDSSNNETTPSVLYDTLTVSSGYLLTVTVPEFPAGVDKAWVYVGPSASVYYQQATAITTSGGTWTEPVGGYSTGGSSPPTSNALDETVICHFMGDTFEIIQHSAKHYSMRVEIEELFGAETS